MEPRDAWQRETWIAATTTLMAMFIMAIAAAPALAGGPRLAQDAITVQLNNLFLNRATTATATVKNIGDAPLTIAAKGCDFEHVVPVAPEKAIPAGESASVSFKVRPIKPGRSVVTCSFDSNAGPIKATLQLNVLAMTSTPHVGR